MKKFFCLGLLFLAGIFAGIREKVKPYIPTNPIIFEAGAFDGQDSILMAKMWPEGTVHSFEPVPYLYNSCCQRTKNQRNIHLYPYAVSDFDGKATFFVSSGYSKESSSLLEPLDHLSEYPTCNFEEEIEVQVVSLDTWAEQAGVDHVDFMWLDMQGAEFNMLKGSKKIFPTVSVIYTEINFKEMYKDCALFAQYDAWLCQHGFKRIELQDSGKGWGNALYVRKIN